MQQSVRLQVLPAQWVPSEFALNCEGHGKSAAQDGLAAYKKRSNNRSKKKRRTRKQGDGLLGIFHQLRSARCWVLDQDVPFSSISKKKQNTCRPKFYATHG